MVCRVIVVKECVRHPSAGCCSVLRRTRLTKAAAVQASKQPQPCTHHPALPAALCLIDNCEAANRQMWYWHCYTGLLSEEQRGSVLHIALGSPPVPASPPAPRGVMIIRFEGEKPCPSCAEILAEERKRLHQALKIKCRQVESRQLGSLEIPFPPQTVFSF